MLSFLLSIRMVALLTRNANFGIYSAGSSVSLIGMWMQRIAIGWLAWQLTGSGFWLGIVAFADFFPVVLVGPFAGAAADRWDRLRVVKVCQAIALAQAAVLWWLTLTGHVTIGILVGLTAFQGVVVAFNQPARLALVPSLVPHTELAGAVAVNSIVFNLARFIGPIFAGLAIVWADIATVFAINAVTYVAFIFALARIRIAPTGIAPGERRSLVADLSEGIRYTATHPGIASLLILLIALGIGGRPMNELLPGFADEVYRSGALGLSILASAIGGGAILGGFWLGQRARTTGLTGITLWSTLVGALATIVAIATDRLWVAVPAVVVFGFCMSTAGIAAQTLVQLAADRSMRGRVMGLYGLIFRGSPAVGALIAGLAASYFGLRWPVFFGALLVIAVWLKMYLNRERIAAALETRDTESGV